jgi:hypothetical protein
MEIYKISVVNEELKDVFSDMYFLEQRTAEAAISTFDQLATKGKKFAWKREVINVMSHEESAKYLFEALAGAMPPTPPMPPKKPKK